MDIIKLFGCDITADTMWFRQLNEPPLVWASSRNQGEVHSFQYTFLYEAHHKKLELEYFCTFNLWNYLETNDIRSSSIALERNNTK